MEADRQTIKGIYTDTFIHEYKPYYHNMCELCV